MDDSVDSLTDIKPQEDKPVAPEVEGSTPPVAGPPQLREDQIQNALAFLSHPKVWKLSTA
jgi:hypothetical protein